MAMSNQNLNKIISTDDYDPPLEYNFKPTNTTPRDDVDYVELSKLIHRKLQKFATFLRFSNARFETLERPDGLHARSG